MFLIVAPTGVGRPPEKQIGELEDSLIQTGVAKNPKLLNVRGTKRADWSIEGVIRASRGKPTKASASGVAGHRRQPALGVTSTPGAFPNRVSLGAEGAYPAFRERTCR
jgi:hypothetical protein